MTALRHLTISEADWQAQVIDVAHLFGWRCAHFRAAKTDRGWRTPVQADGAGFPDLVLVRGPELLVVELKAQRGRLSVAQTVWLDAFGEVAVAVEDAVARLIGVAGARARMPTVEVHVWRPSDFEEMQARLARGRTRIRAEHGVPLPTPPEAA